MIDFNKEGNKFLSFKIIQSGEIVKVPLTPANLRKKFYEIFDSLLQKLKLKQKETFMSNNEGKMINTLELDLSLEEIINKYGLRLKVYSERIF